MHMLMGKNTQRLLNTLARNVKAAREEIGYSQIRLAEKADLSRGHINDIEQGRKGVTLESLQNLACALGVEPWMLLYPEGRSASVIADVRFARRLVRTLQTSIADAAAETGERLLGEHLHGALPEDAGRPSESPRAVSFRDAHRRPDPFAEADSQASEPGDEGGEEPVDGGSGARNDTRDRR
ncbi:MAG: helix-turn-helix domain-containing protein, partial [Spirochaetota bacterium]